MIKSKDKEGDLPMTINWQWLVGMAIAALIGWFVLAPLYEALGI
jgi:hypothetical protein